MAIQTASNKRIAIMRQAGGLGSPASGAGATTYDVFASQGLKLNAAAIPNPTIRNDGQTKRQRQGSRSSSAAYKVPFSVGTHDPLLEAALRGTYTASVTITQATTFGGSAAATSITTTTSTIVAAAGDWRLQGVHKGCMVQLTGHSTAANNGKWYRVIDVSALTITLPSASLTTDATPDTTFNLIVAKLLTNPQTLVERYHTIEEYLQDLGAPSTKSVLGTDMKVTKLDLNAQPDALIDLTFTFMGLDARPQTTAPILTGPTASTAGALVMADGLIRVGGVDQAVLEGFQLTWDMKGEVPKTLSRNGPDVILAPGTLTGSFSAIRQDLTFLTDYSAETQLDLFLTAFVQNATDPKTHIQIYIGNLTIGDLSTGIAQTGPDVETISWGAGIDDAGGASALTTMMISTSAA